MASSIAPRAGQTPDLNTRQLVMVTAWGVFLWFVVALMIRAAPPVLFARGAWTALVFAVALPNAWLTVWLTRKFFGLTPQQIVPGAALASAAAMLCDGIALTWSRLYGPENKDLVPAAAFLLWGVAWILVVAALEAQRGGRLPAR